MSNPFGYSSAIWQRFNEARHGGAFAGGESGVVSVRAGSASARALLVLAVRMQGGAVAQARFQAYGCPTTIAVGEWLAQRIEGKTVEALRALDCGAPVIRAALEIAEDRAHCSLMGEDAYKALITQLLE